MNGFGHVDSLWLIGCGNMAGAMLRRWLEVGLDPATLTVIRPSGAPVTPDVRVLTALPAGEASPRVAMLGVKPQKLDDVAPTLAPLLGADTILLSILAGAEHAALRHRFPQVRTIVRAMPNTPVALGAGVTGLFAPGIGEGDRALIDPLFAALGLAEWTDDEALFEVLGTLTGCGPAYLFRFIDALAAAGAAHGLSADRAVRLATATVEGAGRLAEASDETPGRLADRVASPGGSTRQGLNVLDDGDALRALLERTLAASLRRNREMAAAARQA